MVDAFGALVAVAGTFSLGAGLSPAPPLLAACNPLAQGGEESSGNQVTNSGAHPNQRVVVKCKYLSHTVHQLVQTLAVM